MKKINFKVSSFELDLIDKIVTRASSKVSNQFELMMDLCAVHNEVSLRLDELLHADDFNFFHDVMGIRNNINRETGELENCFMPRFARSLL